MTTVCSEEDAARFGFGDAAALPAAADVALVAALRRRGALRLSPALAQRVADGALLPRGGREEVALRAAAVAAVASADCMDSGACLEGLMSWLMPATRVGR